MNPEERFKPPYQNGRYKPFRPTPDGEPEKPEEFEKKFRGLEEQLRGYEERQKEVKRRKALQEYHQEWEPYYHKIEDEPDTSLWDELWEDEDE